METSRFVLRPPAGDDIIHLAEIDTDPAVMQYIHSGAVIPIEAGRAKWEAYLAKYGAESDFGLWIIEDKANGDFLGWAILQNLDGGEEIEVGYRLPVRAWGRGVATEAARELLRYGFEDLELGEIAAVTKPENRGSRHVLEKIGMRFVGLRDTYYKQTTAYYTLRAHEWREIRSAKA
ncbi:MAG: GNAT family N-acetyltransferase [Candidatus Eremiobacteraeota bacterium]|nr:GNAT family N-acetyltransferase [Candidatus Eremiobacteraeota bacterium]MBC5826752.1 GNAT family N-acetyltransferase [Candidatus Eremiobacteraeota bacterium]